jgi:hypothetical protein
MNYEERHPSAFLAPRNNDVGRIVVRYPFAADLALEKDRGFLFEEVVIWALDYCYWLIISVHGEICYAA